VKGDNDPVDVVEIGSVALAVGSVTPVKPLGVLAMIDDGELDWKIIAIAASDPLANELHDIADVEAKLPGVVSGIREWFRWYKTPDDKPINAFGFGERALPKADALKLGVGGREGVREGGSVIFVTRERKGRTRQQIFVYVLSALEGRVNSKIALGGFVNMRERRPFPLIVSPPANPPPNSNRSSTRPTPRGRVS